MAYDSDALLPYGEDNPTAQDGVSLEGLTRPPLPDEVSLDNLTSMPAGVPPGGELSLNDLETMPPQDLPADVTGQVGAPPTLTAGTEPTPGGAPPFPSPAPLPPQPPPATAPVKIPSNATDFEIKKRGKEVTPEQLLAEGKADEANKRLIESTKTAAGAKVAEAEGAAGNLEELQRKMDAIRAKERADRQELVNRRMSDIAADQARRDQAIKESTKDYWEDKPTWQKVLTSIFLVVGGVAAGRAGTENGALKVLNEEQEKDRRAKLDKLKAKLDKLDINQQQKEHIYKAQEAQIDADTAATTESALNYAKIAEKRLGIPGTRAQAAETVAQLEAKLADDKAKALESRANVVESTISNESVGKERIARINAAAMADRASLQNRDTLVIPMPSGAVYQGRNPAETNELRTKVADLQSARQIAEKLKQLNVERSKINMLTSPIKARSLDIQIAQEGRNLLEKKKAITGALNKADEDTFKARSTVSATRPAAAVNKALDSFVDGMEGELSANLGTKAVQVRGPSQPGTTTAASPQAKTSAKDHAALMTEIKRGEMVLRSEKDPAIRKQVQDTLDAMKAKAQQAVVERGKK